LVAETLLRVIQRADELSEFVDLYWSEGKQPLSAQVKKGLAAAFTKLTSTRSPSMTALLLVKLRDVLFLCHAKPVDTAQADLWKRWLPVNWPRDTWEWLSPPAPASISGEAWERLLAENKLGALACCVTCAHAEAGVGRAVGPRWAWSHEDGARIAVPLHRCCAYAPQWEPELEKAMLRSLEGQSRLPVRPCCWWTSPVRWMRHSLAVRKSPQ